MRQREALVRQRAATQPVDLQLADTDLIFALAVRLVRRSRASSGGSPFPMKLPRSHSSPVLAWLWLWLGVGVALISRVCVVSAGVACGDLRVGSAYNAMSTVAWSNCTSATSLFINGGSPDLSGLANLTTVGGGATSLQVQSVTLSSLEGLHNIDSVDSLSIVGSQVDSLQGLRSLRRVAGMFRVNSNPSPMLNFSLLSSIESAGAIEIKSNAGLLTVDIPFRNLTTLDSLTIDSNYALTTIAGFADLQSVAGNFEFFSNSYLTALPSMPALRSVGFLNVQSNTRLVGFNAFNNLITAASLYITGNDALVSLPDFPALQQITGTLQIYSSALPTLPSMPSLQSAGPIDISGAALSDVGGFPSLTSAASIKLSFSRNLRTVSGLRALTSVGALTFDTCALSSVPGLNALRTAGTINIQYQSFVNFTGFSALVTAADVLLYQNGGLVSLSAFQSLQQITGTLAISGNAITHMHDFDALISAGSIYLADLPATYCGFNSITNVGTLGIQNNPRLVSLCGFQKLQQVSGSVDITSNLALISLAGLNALQSAGYLTLQFNYVLVNVSGFQALSTVGSLLIDSHNRLTAVNAFGSLTQATTTLQITNNAQLAQLPRFDQLILAAAVVISNSALAHISFNNLTTATKLTISSNQFLSALDGFKSLQQVSGAVTIGSNALLTSISGLTSLQSCGSLAVTSNALLSGMTGFSSLTAVGDLTVTGQPALLSLTGFQSLQIVAGTLKLQTLPLITTLAGLESLQSALTITISGNALLSDVSALSAIRFYTTVVITGPSICCPSFAFFAETRLPYSAIICKDCFTIAPAATPMTLPSEGGVTVGLSYNGSIWRNPIYVRAVTTATPARTATAMSTCTVLLTALLCSAPPVLPGFTFAGVPLQLQVSLNQLVWLPIGQGAGPQAQLQYVDFDVWANASAITAGASSFETTAAPGVPDTKRRAQDANDIAVTLVAVVCGIGGGLLIAGLLLLCTSCGGRLGGSLKRVDRIYWIWTRGDHSMVRDATPQGGLFTAISFVMMGGVLAAYLTQVALDNTAVSMALDPRPTDEVRASTFAAAVTFGAPRQFLDATPTFVPAYPGCRGWFAVSTVGFSSQGNATCFFDPAADAVTVQWVCPDCTLELGSGSLSIVAPAPNAFARSIQWQFSSTDYFGDPSTVSGITGADAGAYLKGATLSQASLVVLSTRYTDVNNPTRTGKLMTALNVARGSQVYGSSFGSSTGGVGFSFSVAAQSGWFNIILTTKTSPLAIFAQVMAIIGGVLTLGRLAFNAQQKVARRCGGIQGKQERDTSSKLNPVDPALAPSPLASIASGKLMEMSSIHSDAAQ